MPVTYAIGTWGYEFFYDKSEEDDLNLLYMRMTRKKPFRPRTRHWGLYMQRTRYAITIL